MAALAVPAPAAAHHVVASASARLVDEGVADGRRTVRLEVTGDCGPTAPAGTEMYLRGEIKAAWRGGGRPPFRPQTGAVELVETGSDDTRARPPGSSGVFRYRVSGAILAVGRALVDCEAPETRDADGMQLTEAESRSGASAFTAPLQAPPLLQAIEVTGTSWAVKPGTRPQCIPRGGSRSPWVMWAWHAPDYQLLTDPRSVVGTSSFTRANLRAITLHAVGAGVRVRSAPGPVGYKRYRRIEPGYVIPQRTGTIRFWATVRGLSSNVITVRVRRCRGIIRSNPRG